MQPPISEIQSPLPEPAVTWRRSLDINGLVLLGISAVGFILVPREDENSIHGTWYTLGWPLPTASVKVGYVEIPGRFGLHPDIHPLGLVNLILWIAILLGVRRLAQSRRVPGIVMQGVRLLIVVAAYISAAWLSYGIFNIVQHLTWR